KGRVELDIATVVEDQVELDVLCPRTRHVSDVEFVSVGGQKVRWGAGPILEVADRVRGERRAAGFTVCFARVAPVGLPRSPVVAEALKVGVAVLRDDRGDAFGVPHRQSQAGRSAVVEDVDRITAEPQGIHETVDNVSQSVETVGELAPRGRFSLSETRKIGCDYAIAISQFGYEVPEHVAGGRKAVEQQNNWRV